MFPFSSCAIGKYDSIIILLATNNVFILLTKTFCSFSCWKLFIFCWLILVTILVSRFLFSLEFIIFCSFLKFDNLISIFFPEFFMELSDIFFTLFFSIIMGFRLIISLLFEAIIRSLLFGIIFISSIFFLLLILLFFSFILIFVSFNIISFLL